MKLYVSPIEVNDGEVVFGVSTGKPPVTAEITIQDSGGMRVEWIHPQAVINPIDAIIAALRAIRSYETQKASGGESAPSIWCVPEAVMWTEDIKHLENDHG